MNRIENVRADCVSCSNLRLVERQPLIVGWHCYRGHLVHINALPDRPPENCSAVSDFRPAFDERKERA